MSTATEANIPPSDGTRSALGPLILRILLIAACFGFFYFVVHTFGPLVFPDENTYSMGARHESLSETGMPNYLYYIIYSLTNLAGENFRPAAQLLNAAFYASAAFFIYAIANMTCGTGLSLFIAILALFLPTWSYVAFFMPESMYFAFFWLFAWLVMKSERTTSASFGAWCGAFVGVMSFVKVHAVFLMPGLVFFILASVPPSKPRDWPGAARSVLAAVAAFFVIKFGGGFALAGAGGLSLLGRTYGDYAISLFPIDWGMMSYGFLFSLFGHVMGLCLLFACPLAAICRGVGTGTEAGANPEGDTGVQLFNRLCRFLICVLVPLVALSAAFSTLISKHDAIQPEYFQYTVPQARYYNFLYPGFLLIAGCIVARAGNTGARGNGFSRYCHLIPAAVAAYCAATGFAGYRLVFIPHYPEIGVLFRDNTASFIQYGLLALAVLTAFLWWRGALTASRFFLFVFMPIYLLFTTVAFSEVYVRKFPGFPPLDKVCGEVKELIGDEASHLAIFDLYHKNFSICQYSIDNKDVEFYRTVPGDSTPIDTDALRPDLKWALVVGERSVPKEKAVFSIPYEESTNPELNIVLYRLKEFSFSVDLGNREYAWPISFLQASSTEVAVGYKMFLPRRMRVSIEVDGEAGVPEPVFEVMTPDSETPLVVTGSSGEKREYVLEAPTPSDVVIVRRVDGQGARAAGPDGLPFRRLNVSPETGRGRE